MTLSRMQGEEWRFRKFIVFASISKDRSRWLQMFMHRQWQFFLLIKLNIYFFTKHFENIHGEKYGQAQKIPNFGKKYISRNIQYCQNIILLTHMCAELVIKIEKGLVKYFWRSNFFRNFHPKISQKWLYLIRIFILEKRLNEKVKCVKNVLWHANAKLSLHFNILAYLSLSFTRGRL